MTREREIGKRLEIAFDNTEEGVNATNYLLHEDVPFLLSIIDEQRKALECCRDLAHYALKDADGQPLEVSEPEYKDALVDIKGIAAHSLEEAEK